MYPSLPLFSPPKLSPPLPPPPPIAAQPSPLLPNLPPNNPPTSLPPPPQPEPGTVFYDDDPLPLPYPKAGNGIQLPAESEDLAFLLDEDVGGAFSHWVLGPRDVARLVEMEMGMGGGGGGADLGVQVAG